MQTRTLRAAREAGAVTASAQGIDVSSYQPVLTAAELKPYAFAFAKATDGTNMDPDFPANWQVMKGAGIHRGAYCELWSASAAPVQEQADHFLDLVTAAGLEPGDMLAVVASDYQGVTDAEVKAWLDHVKAAAPKSPVLVYSDLSMLPSLPSCAESYDLWVAWPSGTAPASVAPWKTWRLWQWGETGTDRNAFNGTAAELQFWLDSVAYPALPADWTFGPPQRLQAIGGHTSVRLSWELPAGAPEVPAEYQVFIYSGDVCNRTTIVKTYPRIAKASPWEGGGLERGKSYTAHVVAAGPNDTRAGKYCFASVTFETG